MQLDVSIQLGRWERRRKAAHPAEPPQLGAAAHPLLEGVERGGVEHLCVRRGRRRGGNGERDERPDQGKSRSSHGLQSRNAYFFLFGRFGRFGLEGFGGLPNSSLQVPPEQRLRKASFFSRYLRTWK